MVFLSPKSHLNALARVTPYLFGGTRGLCGFRLPPSGRQLTLKAVVYEWQGKGARLVELLDYARWLPLGEASLQQRLI